MKKFKIFFLLVQIILIGTTEAQEVNWRSQTEESNHLTSLYFGADYSSYYGISYGYVVRNKIVPVIIGTELTIPFGKEMTDDWRGSFTAQTELWHNNHFSFGVKPSFVLRRYESPMARIYNTAVGIQMNFGYLKPRAGVVAVVNYDTPLATHIRHELLKEYYPQVRDGWYGSSGGNFKFGARAHYSFRSWSTFLTVGKSFGQNFKDNPTLPFYAELSVQKFLKSKKPVAKE